VVESASIAFLLGAGRVIGIDRFPDRLRLAQEKRRCGSDGLYRHRHSIAVKEMTGGRGPDRCMDAMGMEADSTGLMNVLEK
jgi:threonine dehydrogenase-like Zn-dependent dehydrogenase